MIVIRRLDAVLESAGQAVLDMTATLERALADSNSLYRIV